MKSEYIHVAQTKRFLEQFGISITKGHLDALETFEGDPSFEIICKSDGESYHMEAEEYIDKIKKHFPPIKIGKKQFARYITEPVDRGDYLSFYLGSFESEESSVYCVHKSKISGIFLMGWAAPHPCGGYPIFCLVMKE